MIRSSRVVGVLAGCAALAGMSSQAPAATADTSAGEATVAGSAPAWATAPAWVADTDIHAQRHVQVTLRLRDPAGAQALAREISTPGTAYYRKPLSSRQFRERFAPAASTVAAVTGWLREQGLHVTGVSSNQAVVDAVADTGTLERAFNTDLARFRVNIGGRHRDLVAPEHDVQVPARLRGVVAGVLGLDDSAQLIRPNHVTLPHPDAPAGSGTGCATSWGQTVNTNVPKKYDNQSNALCGYDFAQTRTVAGLGTSNTGAGVNIGIVGVYNAQSTQSDANRAAARFGAPPLTPKQYRAVDPAGGYHPNPGCEPDAAASEQELDVQAAHTTAPAAGLTYYGAPECSSLLPTLNDVVARNDVGVISMSWGYSGGEASVPPATRQLMDTIGTQAAIQGQSLLVSSGDTGDGSGVAGHPVAAFPAAHPWVTAVGGTSVGLDAAGKRVVETGWTSSSNRLSGNTWVPVSGKEGPFAGGSGGGVSTVYSRPDYQNGTVSGDKRATPDIAGLADVYTGFAVGATIPGQGYEEYSAGGTSLAAPLTAGEAADAAQAAGTDRIGFLNPAIYDLAHTAALRDVTHQAAGVWTPQVVSYGGVPTPPGRGDWLIDFDAKPQSLQSGPGFDDLTGNGVPGNGFPEALGGK